MDQEELDRAEEIKVASLALAGLLANPEVDMEHADAAEFAVSAARALIREVETRPADE